MKRKYKDVDVRDPEAGYAGDPPKRGLYDGKLVEVTEHSNEGVQPGTLRWVFEIVQEPYAGWRGYAYTNDSTTAWKEVGYLLALGIIGEKDVKDGKMNKSVDIDTDKLPDQAGPVRLQVRIEQYDGEGQPKLGKVLPPREGQEAGSSGKAGKAGKSGKKGKKGKTEEEPF